MVILPTKWGGGPKGRRGHDPSARCAGTSPRMTRGGEETAHLIVEYLKLGASLAKIGIVTLSLIDHTMS
jgi:hypothetical protein